MVDDEDLIAERTPLPDAIGGRLREQLVFLAEVDKLKTVLRQSPLAAADRRENDAEHSWHLALMVSVLAEHSDEPIDVGRTVELVVLHDLVEIYAGDTPLYDDAGRESQQEREEAAADRLFGLLPADQAARFRGLWDEFESRGSPEARFAKAVSDVRMPAGLPCARMSWIAFSTTATTVGWPGWPTWPRLAAKSPGPMKMPSTPSTAAMAPTASTASAVSTWTSTQISSWARRP